MKKTIAAKAITVILALIMTAAFAGCADKSTNTGDDIGIDASLAEKLESLKGKVVYNIGEGNVPDLTFRSVLKKNNIAYGFGTSASEGVVTLAYKADGAAMTAELDVKRDRADYGIMGEPAVTGAVKKIDGAEIFLDLQEAYGGEYPQAVAVVKKPFMAANAKYVRDFVTALAGSGNWLKSNPVLGSTALTEAGSTTLSALTGDAVLRSNIKFTAAVDARSGLEQYYNDVVSVTVEGEPNPLGKGGLPADAFYESVPSGGEDTGVRAKVYAPDGAPAMALAHMIATDFAADFTVVPANQIGASMANADIAILPSTAAATLFNNGMPLVLLGVVTNGNLYMLRA